MNIKVITITLIYLFAALFFLLGMAAAFFLGLTILVEAYAWKHVLMGSFYMLIAAWLGFAGEMVLSMRPLSLCYLVTIPHAEEPILQNQWG